MLATKEIATQQHRARRWRRLAAFGRSGMPSPTSPARTAISTSRTRSGHGERLEAATGQEALLDTFDAGADDAVAKTACLGEVVARVHAATRRAAGGARRPKTVAIGEVTIDVAGRRVTCDGEEVGLKRREHDLLAHLATHPGVAFTRDQLLILSTVWPSSAEWQSPASQVTMWPADASRSLRERVTGITTDVQGWTEHEVLGRPFLEVVPIAVDSETSVAVLAEFAATRPTP